MHDWGRPDPFTTLRHWQTRTGLEEQGKPAGSSSVSISAQTQTELVPILQSGKLSPARDSVRSSEEKGETGHFPGRWACACLGGVGLGGSLSPPLPRPRAAAWRTRAGRGGAGDDNPGGRTAASPAGHTDRRTDRRTVGRTDRRASSTVGGGGQPRIRGAPRFGTVSDSPHAARQAPSFLPDRPATTSAPGQTRGARARVGRWESGPGGGGRGACLHKRKCQACSPGPLTRPSCPLGA